jgi:hypothetical protein
MVICMVVVLVVSVMVLLTVVMVPGMGILIHGISLSGCG